MITVLGTYALALALLVLPSQDKGPGQLRFEETLFDFGTIEESAGPVSHTFIYANSGDADAFIASVSPSCSCTTAYYEHKVLHPGEYSELTVTYDPTAMPGQFKQNVLVLTSDKKSMRIYVQGVVKERDKGLDEKYPYFLADGLQASAKTVRYGFVPQKSTSSQTIGIVNTSSSVMKLGYSLKNGDPDLKVSLPQTLKPGQSCEMKIEFSIPSGRLSSLDNELTVIVDGKPAQKSIVITGSAVYSTGIRKGAPSFRFEPTLLVFSGHRRNLDLTISNDGASDLRILKVESPESLRSVFPSGMTVKPGQQKVLKVPRPSSDCRMRVFSNDPARPVRDIIIQIK